MLFTFFVYQSCAIDLLVICLCKGTVVSLKMLLRVEQSSQTKIMIQISSQQREVVSRIVQVGQEESLLLPTEVSSSEYKLEGKTSTGSVLLLYILTPPLLPPPPSSLSLIDSPLSYHYNMSQLDFQTIIRQQQCYELKSLGLDKRTTLILSNIRELDKELFYKLVYLIQSYRWSVLITVHPTLNNHIQSIRLTYGVYVV